MEEEDCGWGGWREARDRDGEIFTRADQGLEALDPDPQTQVHLTKQVWLVFQAVSLPCVRAPGAPNSLLHSHTMTFEPGKIIALEQITYNRQLSVFFCSTEVY